MMRLEDDWEFDVLGVYNFRKPGPFDALFSFIRENHGRIAGDIVEAGVYRGKSLLALGLLLKELGSDKTVYGFDSFSGFPPVYHPKDDLASFERMAERGEIDARHLDAVRRNRRWREALHDSPQTAATISSSGNFSGTSLEFVRRKIELIGLDNVVLVDGPFDRTMNPACVEPASVMAVLMDCDLYRSHLDVFAFTWPRLSVGGMIYLDEYYSLKFPGGRLATNEFIHGKRTRLEMAPRRPGDFERWYLIKEG